MNLPHQELAAKSVERVDKLIDKDAAIVLTLRLLVSNKNCRRPQERLKDLKPEETSITKPLQNFQRHCRIRNKTFNTRRDRQNPA